MSNKCRLFLGIGFFLFFFCASAHAGDDGVSATASVDRAVALIGDRVRLEIDVKYRAGTRIDFPEFRDDRIGDFEIKEDGAITYPLLGSVMVKGLTKQEAEAKITELLAQDYLVNPFVHISVKTYHDRSIMVLGCVQKPGSYPFPQDNTITLLQAISLAGGFTGYASINGTKIVRSAPDGKKITVDPRVNDIVSGKRKDTDLQPDDLVFVPERIF